MAALMTTGSVQALQSSVLSTRAGLRSPAVASRCSLPAVTAPVKASSLRSQPAPSPLFSSSPQRHESSTSVRAEASKQTFTTFEDMVGLSETVLVDFYALWCGPCQLMNGVLTEVSKRAGDDLRIVKIDTEKYPVLASQYKVEALPTFLVFHQGKQVDRIEGAMTADKLLARIDSAVAAASSA